MRKKSGFLSDVCVNEFCVAPLPPTTPPPSSGGGGNLDLVWDPILNGYWYANGTMFMPVDGINIFPPNPCSLLPINEQPACYSGQIPSLPPGSVPQNPIIIDPNRVRETLIPQIPQTTPQPTLPGSGSPVFSQPATQPNPASAQTNVTVAAAGPNTALFTRFGVITLLVVGTAGYGYYLLKSISKPTKKPARASTA